MMSFALTEPQLMDGSKTVTRRTGWATLKPGTRLLAVRKAMGLKAGEKVQPLCEIEIVSVKRQRLDAGISTADAAKEGFPHLTAQAFVDFFCREMRCKPDIDVTRIEFRKVPGTERIAVQMPLV